jgi:cytochrome c-type biogenesis protein
MPSIDLFSALAAGLISFLSPCVLPLVPAYLSFLAGVQLQAGADVLGQRKQLLLSALAFVLGFTLLFVLLGASATAVGHLLTRYSVWFARGSGLLLIILGLHVTGILRLHFLMMEQRIQVSQKPMGILGAFLVGIAFAFGWTPCVGPLLAGILALAGAKQTVGEGMLLLGAYAAGLGIPFLLSAWLVDRVLIWLRHFQRYVRWVEIAAGLLLIAIGLAMFFNSLPRVSAWFGFMQGLSL